MFLNPYKKLYGLCKKGAKLQIKNIEKARLYFSEIDKEVDRLKKKGNRFLLTCNKQTYNLPFPLESVSYFRPFFTMSTHKKIPEVQADDTFAVDFDIPIGSKVYAVEEGVITAMENNSTLGGNNPEYAGKDNYLYIYNKDKNLLFCYRHLNCFTHLKLHQKITKDMYLGNVGLTGYVITPHLHFVIYGYRPGKQILLKSLKIKFGK